MTEYLFVIAVLRLYMGVIHGKAIESINNKRMTDKDLLNCKLKQCFSGLRLCDTHISLDIAWMDKNAQNHAKMPILLSILASRYVKCV